MRALLVHPGPFFSVQDVYTGWNEGLRDNGVEIAEYNLGDRLTFYDLAALEDGEGGHVRAFTRDAAVEMAVNGVYSTCYKWWPDVVVIVSGMFLTPELPKILRSRRHKVVILHTESPYEDDRQLALAEHADLNLINDPTNLDAFREVAPTEYIPHAYRPAVHRTRRLPAKRFRSDFCFVGTGYTSRISWLEQVDWSGLDVALAGNWQQTKLDSPLRKFVVHDLDECLDNEDTARYYAGTKVSLNLYRREANRPDLMQGWAMGPREVELAACGTFYLRDPRPESDELLPMLPAITTPQEFGEQVRWWAAHDTERQKATDAARLAVADRTFTNHAARMLRLLDT
jgi:spore maturation protein CgeB